MVDSVKPAQNIDVPEAEPAEPVKGTLDDFDDEGLFDGMEDDDELDAILGNSVFNPPKQPQAPGN